MTNAVPFTLTEHDNISRTNQPVSVSLPFAVGQLQNSQALALIDNQGKAYPFDAEALSHWHDGSIHWLAIHFQASMHANEEKIFQLQFAQANDKPSLKLSHTKDGKIYHLDTQAAEFSVNTKTAAISVLDQHNNTQPIEANIVLGTSAANASKIVVDTTSTTPELNHQQRLTIKGRFTNNNGETVAHFSSTMTFYAGSSTIKWDISLENHRAAKHQDGLWDLGDPHALFFESLLCQFSLPSIQQLQWQLGDQQAWQQSEALPFKIEQLNSGNDVSTNAFAYTIGEQTHTLTNFRASPTVHLCSSSLPLTVKPLHFWQNHPANISVSKDTLSIGLFPRQAEKHELQAGERKTQTIYLDFSGSPEALNWVNHPLGTTIATSSLQKSQALPFTSSPQASDTISPLINKGINSPNNFFAKRENIDEYGWRDFGDLFADHESLYKKPGEKPFLSHYNNQYDAIYGFARQYLLTGDKRWFELMDDLAKHVCDIDIYHTKEDRHEYNGGLFWHTDHYLDAYSSSHRTYSKQQLNDITSASHGGGPGGQHCYTTGLMMHYLITGNSASKDAVFTLCNWISHFYEGSGSLLEMLLAFKNRHYPGYKNRFSGAHPYPLDRGTGNYIVALLDSYALSHEAHYIQQAEAIIRGTAHPRDDLAARDFGNIEETWFYTIFFQAVLRYLQTKEQLQQLDETYHYAIDCLLHYGQWMLEHEQPYLNTPEKLDYPNITWAAQDIRKANLLYAAHHYSGQQTGYKAAADKFYNYVCTAIAKDPAGDHTRILAILMQNHGQKHYYLDKPAMQERPAQHYKPAPTHKPYHTALHLLKQLGQALCKFSLKREKEWIARRRGTFNNQEGSC